MRTEPAPRYPPRLPGEPLAAGCGHWPAAIVAELAFSGRRFSGLLQRLLLRAVRCYQVAIRPLTGQRCRFHPSCSNYAAEAIAAHGPWHGVALAIGRLLRCHPWHPGGLDPVPRHRNEA